MTDQVEILHRHEDGTEHVGNANDHGHGVFRRGVGVLPERETGPVVWRESQEKR